MRQWSFSNWFPILSVFLYNLLSTLKTYQAHVQHPSVTFHCLQEKVQAPWHGLEFVLNPEASACSLTSSVPPFLTLMSSTSLKKACYFFSFIPSCYLPFPFLEFLCVTSFSPSVLCLDVTFPRRHPLTTPTTGRTGPRPPFSHWPLDLLSYTELVLFSSHFGVFLTCLTLRLMRIGNTSAFFITVFLFPGTVSTALCVLCIQFLV